MPRNIVDVFIVGFDAADQLLTIKIFCIRHIRDKKWEYNEVSHIAHVLQ
jgi:hypothetical protein